jgi:multicomponent Na+:H+ antiporter subunit D
VLLLSAIGLVFAATGTVSMAELASRLAELPEGLRVGLNLLLLLAFGMKAAVFPLFFWLPDSYPTAPSPVAAIFAGLLTKIGVYAMIRTETLLFPGGQRGLLLVVAGFTMIVGVLGAIAQADMKRIISFHIISQIGYMVMGLGIGGSAALAATVFYMLHHIPTKTSLFLIEGIIERRTGTSNLDRVGGLLHRSGPFALLFLIPALSLAGIPPKIWVGAFWGKVEPPVPPSEPVGILRSNKIMSVAALAAVGSSVCIAIFAGPLYAFCEAAAQELVDPSAYVRAVFGR